MSARNMLWEVANAWRSRAGIHLEVGERLKTVADAMAADPHVKETLIIPVYRQASAHLKASVEYNAESKALFTYVVNHGEDECALWARKAVKAEIDAPPPASIPCA